MNRIFPGPSGPSYNPIAAELTAGAFEDGGSAYHSAPAIIMQPQALAPSDLALPEGAASGPNPYIDYARRYPAEGGVELTYKSDDTGFWHVVFRVVAWIFLMAAGSWLTAKTMAWSNGCDAIAFCIYSGFQAKFFCIGFLVTGGILGLLLSLPVHRLHTIEIRRDCLILDGADVFWTEHMEARPHFEGYAGAQTLKGIYGTRHIDFFTLKPVDENDATPTVLANHIEDALKQLWDQPQVWAGD